MYFCQGTPKIFTIKARDRIVHARYSNDQKYFATLTTTALYIWSTHQHRILLGSFKRDGTSFEEDGPNEELYWLENNNIVLTTKNGRLLFLTLIKEKRDLFEVKLVRGNDSAPHFAGPVTHPLAIDYEDTYYGSLAGINWLSYDFEGTMTVLTKDGFFQRLQLNDDDHFEVNEQQSIFSINYTTPTRKARSYSGNPSNGTPTQSPSHSLNAASDHSVSSSPSQVHYMNRARSRTSLDSSDNGPLIAESNSLKVVHVDYVKEMNMFGVVFSDGRAAIVKTKWETSLQEMEGFWLTAVNDATRISINRKSEKVAVGCSSGEVIVFTLDDYSFLRLFTMSHWGLAEEDTGAVSCLEWTPEGSALAVGYASRGLSVWSLYGCRLHSTIPNQPIKDEKEDSDGNKIHSREVLSKGVSHLAWGPEGYHLIATSFETDGLFTQFSFVKSCLANTPNMNYCHRLLFKGDDRIMILLNKSRKMGELKWSTVQLPTTFITDNWPVRHVAISYDGNNIAVSGRRGFAIYNTITKRWKLFGDVKEEQEIECCGLCWFKDAVIVTNHNRATNSYEVRFYLRTRLSNAAMLYKATLPQNKRPLYLDCNDSYLVLFTADACFYQYSVILTGDKENVKVSLKLDQQVSMAKAATLTPTAMLLLPSAANKSAKPKARKSVKCLILDPSGTLMISNAEQSLSQTLSTSVEQFWMANTELEDLGNTLWAYGRNGLQLWFPFLSETETQQQPMKFFSRDRFLEFDLDIYPIGFIPHWAVIIGITQLHTYSPCSNLPFYDLQTRTHPFLQSVLRTLLERGEEQEAIKLAKKYSFIPHFAHCLELLLYDTLETEYQSYSKARKQSATPVNVSSDNVPPPPLINVNAPPVINIQAAQHHQPQPIVVPENSALLRVARFLQHFPQFPELVANCARKVDPNCWPLLFRCTGDPYLLFEQCIKNEWIDTSTSYMRILHLYSGVEYARRGAIKLLDLTLKYDNLDLLRDLMRFLEPLGNPEHGEEDALVKALKRGNLIEDDTINSPKKLNIGVDTEDEEFYLQELLLAKYARKLLQKKQMRTLIIFGNIVHKELRLWLSREKRRSALVEDLQGALDSIHRQFDLPFPEVFPLNAIQADVTEDESSSSSANSSPRLQRSTSSLGQYSSIMSPSKFLISSGSSFQGPKIDSPIKRFIEIEANNIDGSLAGIDNQKVLQRRVSVAHIFGTVLKKSVLESINDLEYLLQETLIAQCYEWSLVIATVLFNVDIILGILKDVPALLKLYKPALEVQKCYGYRELNKYLLPKIEEIAAAPSSLKNSGAQSTSPPLKPMNGTSPVKSISSNTKQ